MTISGADGRQRYASRLTSESVVPQDRVFVEDRTSALEDDDVLELRDYLAVVRRRRKVVIVTVVAVVIVTLALSFVQTPVYKANAELLLQSRASEQIFSPESNQPVRADPARVDTEIGVMKSRSVRQAVAAALGRSPDVSIQAQGQTDLVTVSAESTEPAEAANEANTYAKVYIDTRRRQLVSDLETAIDQVQAKITEIDNQLDQIDQPLTQLDARIAAADGAAARAELQAQRTELDQRIKAERDDVESQRTPYVAQLGQLQLATNLTQTGGAQIVSQAEAPTSPVRPTPARNGVLALVVGLMLGVGLAFLREYLDDTVKTKDDLQQAAGGLPVLGLIPMVETWKDRGVAKVVSITEPQSPVSEAYRSLRTAVQFVGLDHPLKVIQVTSPNASEGKTTTLANLAVALAGAGQRVVVVSCDLRRPRIHDFLGLGDDVGFTSVLLGEVSLSASLQMVPGQGKLALLAAGPIPPNPSELLASKRTEQVLDLLKSECDILLVDTPPVLPVTDAIVLSRLVDATVLVGTANRTTRKEIHRTVELLRQVGAPLVGTVLNGVDAESTYGYGARYGSTYGYGPIDAGAKVDRPNGSVGNIEEPTAVVATAGEPGTNGAGTTETEAAERIGPRAPKGGRVKRRKTGAHRSR